MNEALALVIVAGRCATAGDAKETAISAIKNPGTALLLTADASLGFAPVARQSLATN
jgi:hypothetical protein